MNWESELYSYVGKTSPGSMETLTLSWVGMVRLEQDQCDYNLGSKQEWWKVRSVLQWIWIVWGLAKNGKDLLLCSQDTGISLYHNNCRKGIRKQKSDSAYAVTGRRTRKERTEEGVIIEVWGHGVMRGEGCTIGAEKWPRVASRTQFSCKDMLCHGLILLHPLDLLPGLSSDKCKLKSEVYEPTDTVL